MAKRIYSFIIALSIVLGTYVYMIKESHSKNYLIVITSLVFLLFSAGIHGVLAHSLKPSVKRGLIAYPILMGVLWALLFFLFVFFILPVFCPDFFGNLNHK